MHQVQLALNSLKTKIEETLGFKVEFIITNERLTLKSVDYFLEQLKKLKEIQEMDKKGVKNGQA